MGAAGVAPLDITSNTVISACVNLRKRAPSPHTPPGTDCATPPCKGCESTLQTNHLLDLIALRSRF